MRVTFLHYEEGYFPHRLEGVLRVEVEIEGRKYAVRNSLNGATPYHIAMAEAKRTLFKEIEKDLFKGF